MRVEAGVGEDLAEDDSGGEDVETSEDVFEFREARIVCGDKVAGVGVILSTPLFFLFFSLVALTQNCHVAPSLLCVHIYLFSSDCRIHL